MTGGDGERAFLRGPGWAGGLRLDSPSYYIVYLRYAASLARYCLVGRSTWVWGRWESGLRAAWRRLEEVSMRGESDVHTTMPDASRPNVRAMGDGFESRSTPNRHGYKRESEEALHRSNSRTKLRTFNNHDPEPSRSTTRPTSHNQYTCTDSTTYG
jgi:hypothetical protein